MPNRIFGATGLSGSDVGNLNQISSNLTKDNDLAIVNDGTSMYFYTMDEDSGLSQNLPYVVIPYDAEGSTTNEKRWILVSENTLRGDFTLDNGATFSTLPTSAYSDPSTFTFTPGGLFVHGRLYSDSQIVSTLANGEPFVVSSTQVCENLNADMLDDLHSNDFLHIDGTNDLVGHVSSPDPLLPGHIATKRYVDLDNIRYPLVDGTRGFASPVSGQTPILGSHLVTKDYLTTFTESMSASIPKNFRAGSKPLTNGISSQIVSFSPEITGSYTVTFNISNVNDTIPSFYNTIVTSKDVDRFTVTFSDTIDSDNYVLEWTILT